MVKSYLIKFVALSQSISVLFFSIVVAILCFVRLKINLKIVLSYKKQTNKNKHFFEIGKAFSLLLFWALKMRVWAFWPKHTENKIVWALN